jgi:uridylate kinase
MANPAYKRIMLKVSGEALSGDQSFGIQPEFLNRVAAQIADVSKKGIELAIVTGGGNIFRGMSLAADGGDRVTADMMGTLGTVINALALASALTRKGVKCKVFSATTMP